MMTTIAITSEVFQWARDRAGLTDEKLAKKIHARPEKIHAWETGQAFPNFQQAQKLASAFGIPLGYLFLSRPPQLTIPIADFRSLPGTEKTAISPNLQEVLDDALRKRDWYAEWRKEEGLGTMEFVGKFSIQSQPEAIIKDMRQVLEISPDFAAHLKSWDEHLRFLVQKVEAGGILVLQSGIVGNNTTRRLSLAEFRGFTLADPYAPLIFLNAQDSITARIFTLAHELAHLWTGTSGISNPDITPHAEDLDAQEVEQFCNRVAADFLVPQPTFTRLWERGLDTLDNVDHLACFFRVSTQVILRRSFELNIISRDEFFRVYPITLKAVKVNQSQGGGDFYNTLFSRNSRRFTRELLSAVFSGNVSYMEGARLLNTHPSKLVKAMKKMG
jgi:Zn-dependent peptidase ImmA (M78 family)/DNA-binding XRE family transcriptional regulator